MAATHIMYKGIMYRLAAEVPPETILETGTNPTTPATPAADNSSAASPSPADDDIKTLELLVGNVTSKATALATVLAPLIEKVKTKSRSDSDSILSGAKGSLDSLVEDFKLLASKYAGVARRSMGENKTENKD